VKEFICGKLSGTRNTMKNIIRNIIRTASDNIINHNMNIIHTKLSKELAIEENLFMHNNVLYERLYNHKCYVTGEDLKYRFFIDEDEYDYTNKLK
jgi:hypothetical protein